MLGINALADSVACCNQRRQITQAFFEERLSSGHLLWCLGALQPNPHKGNAMKTHCTLAVATLALAAATSALAAPPNAEGETAPPAAVNTLTTEAVVSDLVKFRQSDPATQQPRDGEWYTVSAPLGYPMPTVNHGDTDPAAQAMPTMQRANQNDSGSQ